MDAIYHVCSARAWEAAKDKGMYEHPSLAEEGFIHCSKAEQVDGVLTRYFRGQQNLVRLQIEPHRLSSELKWETAPSLGEAFPHIYGPINVDAVTDVKEIEISQ